MRFPIFEPDGLTLIRPPGLFLSDRSMEHRCVPIEGDQARARYGFVANVANTARAEDRIELQRF